LQLFDSHFQGAGQNKVKVALNDYNALVHRIQASASKLEREMAQKVTLEGNHQECGRIFEQLTPDVLIGNMAAQTLQLKGFFLNHVHLQELYKRLLFLAEHEIKDLDMYYQKIIIFIRELTDAGS
jgi:hypothetical protein